MWVTEMPKDAPLVIELLNDFKLGPKYNAIIVRSSTDTVLKGCIRRLRTLHSILVT